MLPVLTAEEYRRVDKAFDGDLDVAMDKAGYAVALAAARAGAAYGKRVAVLVGPGNNGGDGYVAARYLKERGAEVRLFSLGEPATAESRRAAAKTSVPVAPLGRVEAADVVIDALFGGGVRSPIPTEVRAWMETDPPVVAVDYPTGLDPNTGAVPDAAFRAVETVTFSTLKYSHLFGQGPEYCGKVTVADIGISGGEPCMYVAQESDTVRPVRKRKTHKWSAGAVLVVGGSDGIVGAVTFAGRAALEFGAGSVVVATPNPAVIHQNAPQLPTMTFSQAAEQLDRFDVVLAGPGLAVDDHPNVRSILRKASRVVLDAGALVPDLLDDALEAGGEVVMTPHDAEFARVAGVNAGTFSTRAFARKRGITVVRKGNPTVVTHASAPPTVVTTGGPELATIGTGDVLAGMVAALWSRGSDPQNAAVTGAYFHGVAGAGLTQTGTVTAERLVGAIGRHAW